MVHHLLILTVMTKLFRPLFSTVLLLVLYGLLGAKVVDEFRWKELTQEEMEQWYSPTDLCVLNSTDKFTFPQDTRVKDCAHLSKGKRSVHCSVGMGNNRQPCFGPFGSGRPHFKMGLEGFTNFSSKPLLAAFTHFANTNTTPIFLGDSTTRQKLQAMQCELEREHPRIRTSGNIWGILPCNTKYTVYLPDGQSLYVRIISMGPNSADCLKGGLNKDAPANGIYENAAYVIDQENNLFNRSVFVVANIGLWYNEESDFASVVPSTLDWLQSVATSTYKSNIDFTKVNLSLPEESHIHPLNHKNPENAFSTAKHAQLHNLHNTVVWHETFSQHWVNPWGSGYFAKPQVEHQVREWTQFSGKYETIATEEYVAPFCCRSITNTSRAADWRNDLVNAQLEKSDTKYKDIKLFPMASITR